MSNLDDGNYKDSVCWKLDKNEFNQGKFGTVDYRQRFYTLIQFEIWNTAKLEYTHFAHKHNTCLGFRNEVRRQCLVVMVVSCWCPTMVGGRYVFGESQRIRWFIQRHLLSYSLTLRTLWDSSALPVFFGKHNFMMDSLCP